MNTEQLETVLRSGSQQVAQSTQLSPAQAVRARGDRYRRRRVASAAALGLIVMAGAVASVTAVAAQAGRQAGGQAATPGLDTPLHVQITQPAVYAYDTLNPVTLTIHNTGKPRTV